jgi:hypothetical protein
MLRENVRRFAMRRNGSIMAAVRTKQAPKTRRDPIRRTADGISPQARLRNTDPSRKYVWVNTADSLAGVDYYLANGYEIEQRRPDGPQQVGRQANPFRQLQGLNETYIIFMGNVLMSCQRDVADEIDQYGGEGGIGQVGWDAVEKQITGREHGRKLLKNIPGIIGRDGEPVILVENETSPAAPEIGL